jgi:hypothetical protein
VNRFDDDLRRRLHDGLPPRVRGMAEAIIVEWEQAVAAVPELERLALEDMGQLAAMPAEEREQALRRRWSRLHDVPAPIAVTGRALRPAGAGRAAAAR